VSSIFDATILNQSERWTTKDGKTLAIREMTFVHLINTVRLLERHARGLHWALEGDEYLFDLCFPSARGRLAGYYQEQEIDDYASNGLSQKEAKEWLASKPLVVSMLARIEEEEE
jgi:hypothetical protein